MTVFERSIVRLTKGALRVSILAALLSTITAIFIKFQWWEMRSGSVDTHRLAVAAGEQADAATTANRAWLVVKATSFGYLKDKEGTPRASSVVVLTNTGPSPAFNLHVWRCAQVRTDEPSTNVMPNELSKDCVSNDIGMVGKDVPIPMHVNDLTQVVPENSVLNDTHAVGMHFYAWGRITYDIYPKDKSHFVSFCLMNADNQLGACPHGNEGN